MLLLEEYFVAMTIKCERGDKIEILKSDTKQSLLNLIGKKTVSFILDTNKVIIPDSLKKFHPSIDNNKLFLNYDKNKTKLKEIINILNKNQISFNEINTYESDLKDVFIDLINK